jgi:hypothetical protein
LAGTKVAVDEFFPGTRLDARAHSNPQPSYAGKMVIKAEEGVHQIHAGCQQAQAVEKELKDSVQPPESKAAA